MTPKNTKILADASEKTPTPWGERILARLGGKPLTTFAKEAGLNPTSFRDMVYKVSPGAEPAVRIAQALDVSVEWLITGQERRPRGSLRSADDAEWVDLPRYDLHAFTPEGKPEPAEVIPIRRDWLYSHVRRSKNLWLAELPTSKFPALGIAGDLILCEDTESWAAQGFYLWFLEGKPIVRNFPEDKQPPPPGTWEPDEPPGMRIAARILGTFGLKPA
ncbi:MAG: hypothetical protein KGQ52_13085 [Alphaproteobacteria bacterium]|nr:hypothetical protein [Alphaproteobacteria bacterium]